MGFKFTQAAFNCTKAGGLDKLVLWIICEHANEKNDSEAWPSIRTIADEAGIAPSTAFNATKSLEALGLITVMRTKIKTDRGTELSLVNRYKPNLGAMGGVQLGGGGCSYYGTPCSFCGTPCSPDGTPCSCGGTEPVIEPVREPVREKDQTPNQPTNQPINHQETATPSLSSPPSEETPLGMFEDGIEVWDYAEDRARSPLEKQAWVKKELVKCWWHYKHPTEQDLRFMYEALLVCETKQVQAQTLIHYGEQHFGHRQKTKGLVIRSPKDLHRSLCGPDVSQTNGLHAQYEECLLKPCPDCKRKDAEGKVLWLNPNFALHAHHPVAPPPPPITICATCGGGFEAVGSRAGERNCMTCTEKKSDEAFIRLLREERINPTSDKARYERLVRAGRIPVSRERFTAAAVGSGNFETEEL